MGKPAFIVFQVSYECLCEKLGQVYYRRTTDEKGQLTDIKTFRKEWYKALQEAGWTEQEFLEAIYAKGADDSWRPHRNRRVEKIQYRLRGVA